MPERIPNSEVRLRNPSKAASPQSEGGALFPHLSHTPRPPIQPGADAVAITAITAAPAQRGKSLLLAASRSRSHAHALLSNLRLSRVRSGMPGGRGPGAIRLLSQLVRGGQSDSASARPGTLTDRDVAGTAGQPGQSAAKPSIPLAGDLVELLTQRLGADRAAKWVAAKLGASVVAPSGVIDSIGSTPSCAATSAFETAVRESALASTSSCRPKRLEVTGPTPSGAPDHGRVAVNRFPA